MAPGFRRIVIKEDGLFENGQHRTNHPADDDRVDDQRDINRSQVSQPPSGGAGVAEIDQFHIGDHLGSPP